MKLVQAVDTTSNRSITIKVSKMEKEGWDVPDIDIHVLEGTYENIADFDKEWDERPREDGSLEFLFSLDIFDARRFTNALVEEIQSEE